MNPQVSIIVTCYNHENFIETCLRSIFQQSYQNIQLLIIDDGSTDRSPELIEELLPESPFSDTQFFKEMINAGVCVTRNIGLDHAKGDFVLFVDSDDYLDLDFLDQLVTCASETQGDIVYCDLVNAGTQEVFLKAQDFELVSFLTQSYISNTSLIRRSIIGEHRFDLELNRKFLEDYEFLIQLIIDKKAKPVYARGTKVNYRILENSISRKEDHDTREYYIEVYFYIIKKHIKVRPFEILEAIKANDLIAEARINDLIDHMDQVTEYVKKLEKQKELLEKQKHLLAEEKTELLESRSFRLGQKIIKPLNLGVRALKNPKLVGKAAKRVAAAGKRRVRKLPPPQRYINRLIRDHQRPAINLEDPKRCLIYVIYADGKKLQEYKFLFLEAVAALSQEVHLVINGQPLTEDLERLTPIGKVHVRENRGYDTAAFRYGIQTLGQQHLSQFDQLLLINDTNIGPISDLTKVFDAMKNRKLDFWGMTYGEEQVDITGLNPYKYIPFHIQSYFMVIEANLLRFQGFFDYWNSLADTDSREKAIGQHETVFTRYFADLGFRHAAYLPDTHDSAMYIHPLRMLKAGSPLIKYSALTNYSDEKFLWQGLDRKTEIPELLEYVAKESDFPVQVIEECLKDIQATDLKRDILIIDGVENAIPQCTRYRVLNKAEQLRSLGFPVRVVDQSKLRLSDAEKAELIIVYRCGYSDLLGAMVNLSKRFFKTVLYDIDDLVIDTKYTDQLAYTQGLSSIDKGNYDAGVIGYGRMLQMCDGAVTSTNALQRELRNYQEQVLLNRNIASEELVEISKIAIREHDDQRIKLGYFSGSITHNENFQLIKSAILQLMTEFDQVELHLVGYLDIPHEFQQFSDRLVFHEYVEWHELPGLISEVDINLAPLTHSIFNEAKSEIKWLEAALVKVPTVASAIGAFEDMIESGKTGILAADDSWFDQLKKMVASKQLRDDIAEGAYRYALENCVTTEHKDQFVNYLIKHFSKLRK